MSRLPMRFFIFLPPWDGFHPIYFLANFDISFIMEYSPYTGVRCKPFFEKNYKIIESERRNHEKQQSAFTVDR